MSNRICTLALATALALGTATIAVWAPPAQATSFAEMSVEQFTDASTYIVRGTVEGRPWTDLNEQGYVYTHAKIRVSEVLKGPDKPTELVVSQMGGVHGATTTNMPGQAVFSDGEKVFLFLARAKSGRIVTVSKSLGKYTIRRAPGERSHYVRTWQAAEGTRSFDHRFLPHPEAADRIYLDNLVDKVQDRLERGWDGTKIPGLTDEQLEARNTAERRMPR